MRVHYTDTKIPRQIGLTIRVRFVARMAETKRTPARSASLALAPNDLPPALNPGTIASMQTLATILPFAQIILAVLLIVAVLLQSRGSSLGGAFGGDNMGTTFYTRRGPEKVLFQGTIALSILFALSSFVALFV